MKRFIVVGAVGMTALTVSALVHKHYEANFSPTFKANAMASMACGEGANPADLKWYTQQARLTAKTDRDRAWVVQLDHLAVVDDEADQEGKEADAALEADRDDINPHLGETRVQYLTRILANLKREKEQFDYHSKLEMAARDQAVVIQAEMWKDLGNTTKPCSQGKGGAK